MAETRSTGISSAVRIYDGMSPALRSITKTLDIVLNSFNRLQAVSSASIDVTGIAEAKAELASAGSYLDQLENDLNSAAASQDRYTESVERSGSSMDGLVRKVAGLAAGYASMQSIGKVVDFSDELARTESRLSLVTDNVEDAQNRIMEAANRSRSDFSSTASIVASISGRAGEAFDNDVNAVIAFTETLNKMYKLSGASSQEQASSMLQLTQALGSGVLRGEEFNAVLEASPNIIQAIADYMGKPKGELKDLAAEGAITAGIVRNAIFSAADSVNADFENMRKTWGDVTTLIKNSAVTAFGPVLDKINDMANSGQIEELMFRAQNVFMILSDVAMNTFNLIGGVATFISDNWGYIAPVVLGIAAALALYNGALAVHNGILAVSKIATTLMTASQTGFNAALLACPITWIVAGIIALVAAIYWIVNAYNDAKGASVSATGVIMGSVAVGAAFIWNLVLALIDNLLHGVNTLYSTYAMFANFISNIFVDPIGAVVHLFGDFVDYALSCVETVLRALDKITGQDWASTIAGWRENLAAKVEIVAEKYGNGKYEKVLHEKEFTAESLGLKRWDYSDKYNAGYSLGEKVDNKVSNLFGGVFDPKEHAGNSSEDYSGFLGDITGNTEKLANSVDISQEDLKYLRDIAERDAINQFTTAEIKIDMNNVNNLSSDMDIDGFIGALEEKLYNSMEIAAEGSY